MNYGDIACCKKASRISLPDPLGCNLSDLENYCFLGLPPLTNASNTLLPADMAHHFSSAKFSPYYIRRKYRSKELACGRMEDTNMAACLLHLQMTCLSEAYLAIILWMVTCFIKSFCTIFIKSFIPTMIKMNCQCLSSLLICLSNLLLSAKSIIVCPL